MKMYYVFLWSVSEIDRYNVFDDLYVLFNIFRKEECKVFKNNALEDMNESKL